jgi:hypothetical protein
MAESLGFAIAIVTAGALVPTYVGLFAEGVLNKFVGKRATAAVSFGIILFLFLDLMELTAQLGIEVRAPLTQLGLWLSFGMGFLILAAGSDGRIARWGGIALLWAIGLAFHSGGEGSVIAAEFRSEALELTIFQASSFTLHKLLEGFSMGSLRSGAQSSVIESVILTTIAAGPSPLMFLAVVFGLPVSLSTYLFAAGAGSAVFALVRSWPAEGGRLNARFLTLVLLGILSMYLAGLLHEF